MRERATSEPVSGWLADRPGPAPAAGRLDVWLFSLDRPPLALERLAELLAPDERERADRFRFDVHRDRYVAGRGLVRLALGRALGTDPASLAFRYGAKGKPSLPAAPLQFNLSHSQDLALLAIAGERELGVDIEALRPIDDAPAIVERFFAPRERDYFRELPPERQLLGFYSGWTRKEAYVKARGDGLSLPTTAFEMEIAPERPARLVAFDEEPAEVTRWSFGHLEPAEGFVGAVAVEGELPEVVGRLWRE